MAWLVLGWWLCSASSVFAAAPANDNFANRLRLTGPLAVAPGNCATATSEPGEPEGSYTHQTLWWVWTAPASGPVAILNDIFTDGVALVSVYTGNSLGSLVVVTQGFNPSFQAVAGTSYQLQVEQPSWSVPGSFLLRLQLTTVVMTSPTDEADFRAPASLDLVASPLAPDTVFASVTFYENGTEVGAVTSPPFQARRTDLGVGSFTYWAVAVDDGGVTTTSAPVSIKVTPANDDFAHRVPLAGSSLALTVPYAPATSEPGEHPNAWETNFHRVWFSWTAPFSGVAHAWTEPEGLPQVSVFTGDAIDALTSESTDWGGLFRIVAGTTYQIGLGSWEVEARETRLRLEAYHAAVNENFADRLLLSGTNLSMPASNYTYAAFEPEESSHALFSIGRSVWWTWTAPASGPVTFSTSGAEFQTAIAIYTGSTLAQLAEVAAGAYDPVQFYAFAGTNYQIAVDVFPDDTHSDFGYFQLKLELTPSPRAGNDDFADRFVLTGTSLVVTGSNFLATRELGEPQHGGVPGQRSLWWSWTAPDDGALRIDAVASRFQPLLAIYEGDTLANLSARAGNQYGTVYVRVRAGVSYAIALDGGFGQYGDFQLTFTHIAPPPNDDFDHAFLITGFPAVVEGTNGVSSVEPGEPEHHFPGMGGYSIWWNWTAPSTRVVTASIRVPGGLGWDAIGVYTGDSVSALTTITNRVIDATWLAHEGVTYHIAVDGTYSPFVIRLVGPPANDDFTGRTVLTGETNMTVGTNLGATVEPGEPSLSQYDPGGRSVWWSWTAPGDGHVKLFALGNYSEYGELMPMIGIYTGDSLASLVSVARSLYTSEVRFPVRSGVTYQIQVDGSFGRSGEVSVYLRFVPPGPPLAIDRLNLRREPTGRMRIPVLGTPDDLVSLEFSRDLHTWQELSRTELTTEPWTYFDFPPPSEPRRFYRVRNLSAEP